MLGSWRVVQPIVARSSLGRSWATKAGTSKGEPTEEDMQRILEAPKNLKEDELEFFPHYATKGEHADGTTPQTPVDEAPSSVTKTSGPTLITVQPIDEKKGILGIEMHRSSDNFLSLDMLRQLKMQIRRANQDAKYVGAVLTCRALPDQHFSRGVDVAELMRMSRGNQKHLLKYWSLMQDVWRLLFSSKMVTVAAISGKAHGLGCALATACDYRIMIDSPRITSSIGLDETSYGLTPTQWAFENLRDIIGAARAQRIAAFGEVLSAKQALHCGLVDQVVESPAQLFEEAMSRIQIPLANTAAEQRIQTKAIVREETLSAFDAHREEELEWVAENWTSDRILKAFESYTARHST